MLTNRKYINGQKDGHFVERSFSSHDTRFSKLSYTREGYLYTDITVQLVDFIIIIIIIIILLNLQALHTR
jgi:hypothetical protein